MMIIMNVGIDIRNKKERFENVWVKNGREGEHAMARLSSEIMKVWRRKMGI